MVKLADLKRLQEERAAQRRQLRALAKEAKAAARARAKLLQKVRRVSTGDLKNLLEEREEQASQPPAASTTVVSTTTATKPAFEEVSTTTDGK